MILHPGWTRARYVVAFRYAGIAAAVCGLLIGEWYTTIPNTIAGGTLSRVLAAIPWSAIVALQFFTLRMKSSTVTVLHAIAMLLAIVALHLSVSAYLYDCNNGYCPAGQEFGNGSDENVENGDALVSVVYVLLLPGLVVTFALAALRPLARIYTCLISGSALLVAAIACGFTKLLWLAVPLLAIAATGAIRRTARASVPKVPPADENDGG